MSEARLRTSQATLDQARRDLMIAAAVAAAAMVGAALFAPRDVLFGVALGALVALANLSVLARIGVQLLDGDSPKPIAALKAAVKMLALMGVVIVVLLTRPNLALGLCLGLALPAAAGLVLALRGPWLALLRGVQPRSE